MYNIMDDRQLHEQKIEESERVADILLHWGDDEAMEILMMAKDILEKVASKNS